MARTSRELKRRLAAAGIGVLAVSLSGCTLTGGSAGSGTADRAASEQVHPASNVSLSAHPTITTNVRNSARNVTVDTAVTVHARHGILHKVAVRMPRSGKSLRGRFNSNHTEWKASQLLQPGIRYVVTSAAAGSAGATVTKRVTFRTQPLRLNQQTYASVAPLQHEVVGVGMPVIVKFDIPVHRRAAFERRMHVTSKPATTGSWHWFSATEVHWRPKHFWKPGTKVHVNLQLNGVNAGDGIYGQMNRSVNFRIGKSVIMKPNLRTDHMKVLVNHHLARVIPITGGKPGFATRSGIKLIIEKYKSIAMDAATVGISPGSPNYYDIPDVRYAQRVTYSGEFLHAAPWSVYAQGKENVSHGCVGMSTANARWLFHLTRRGDPVEVTGTHRKLEPGNGWTDWNESFAQYKKGSAL
jgi:lipoprotein-anchoring transpeptidase ErfK/SrfK